MKTTFGEQKAKDVVTTIAAAFYLAAYFIPQKPVLTTYIYVGLCLLAMVGTVYVSRRTIGYRWTLAMYGCCILHCIVPIFTEPLFLESCFVQLAMICGAVQVAIWNNAHDVSSKPA